jgi:hypothetical protein
MESAAAAKKTLAPQAHDYFFPHNFTFPPYKVRCLPPAVPFHSPLLSVVTCPRALRMQPQPSRRNWRLDRARVGFSRNRRPMITEPSCLFRRRNPAIWAASGSPRAW